MLEVILSMFTMQSASRLLQRCPYMGIHWRYVRKRNQKWGHWKHFWVCICATVYALKDMRACKPKAISKSPSQATWCLYGSVTIFLARPQSQYYSRQNTLAVLISISCSPTEAVAVSSREQHCHDTVPCCSSEATQNLNCAFLCTVLEYLVDSLKCIS